MVIFLIFLSFSSVWSLLAIFSFFHARDDQKMQKINEKTSLTTSLATSSSPPAPHHQRLTNKASRTVLIYLWHPHQPFQLNGRAVVPALPVQSAARSSCQACRTPREAKHADMHVPFGHADMHVRHDFSHVLVGGMQSGGRRNHQNRCIT